MTKLRQNPKPTAPDPLAKAPSAEQQQGPEILVDDRLYTVRGNTFTVTFQDPARADLERRVLEAVVALDRVGAAVSQFERSAKVSAAVLDRLRSSYQEVERAATRRLLPVRSCDACGTTLHAGNAEDPFEDVACRDCASTMVRCGQCECWLDYDDAVVLWPGTDDEEQRCESCSTTSCDECGDDVRADTPEVDGQQLCPDCRDNADCDRCDNRFARSELDDDGLCPECANKADCDECGNEHDRSDLPGGHCPSCRSCAHCGDEADTKDDLDDDDRCKKCQALTCEGCGYVYDDAADLVDKQCEDCREDSTNG